MNSGASTNAWTRALAPRSALGRGEGDRASVTAPRPDRPCRAVGLTNAGQVRGRRIGHRRAASRGRPPRTRVGERGLVLARLDGVRRRDQDERSRAPAKRLARPREDGQLLVPGRDDEADPGSLAQVEEGVDEAGVIAARDDPARSASYSAAASGATSAAMTRPPTRRRGSPEGPDEARPCARRW